MIMAIISRYEEGAGVDAELQSSFELELRKQQGCSKDVCGTSYDAYSSMLLPRIFSLYSLRCRLLYHLPLQNLHILSAHKGGFSSIFVDEALLLSLDTYRSGTIS